MRLGERPGPASGERAAAVAVPDLAHHPGRRDPPWRGEVHHGALGVLGHELQPGGTGEALEGLGPDHGAVLELGVGAAFERGDRGVHDDRGPVRIGVGPQGGRPAHRFGLTAAGEDLFPKRYDDLAVILIDAVGERLGSDALAKVLVSVVDAKVAAWAPRRA